MDNSFAVHPAVRDNLPGQPGYFQSKPKPPKRPQPPLDRESLIITVTAWDEATCTQRATEIIGLLAQGKAQTVSKAAEMLELSPLEVWTNLRDNGEFKKALRLVEQIQADRLEEKLHIAKTTGAVVVRLKKLRPEYRENYRLQVESSNLDTLLTQLRQLGEATKAIRNEKEIPSAAEAKTGDG